MVAVPFGDTRTPFGAVHFRVTAPLYSSRSTLIVTRCGLPTASEMGSVGPRRANPALGAAFVGTFAGGTQGWATLLLSLGQRKIAATTTPTSPTTPTAAPPKIRGRRERPSFFLRFAGRSRLTEGGAFSCGVGDRKSPSSM